MNKCKAAPASPTDHPSLPVFISACILYSIFGFPFSASASDTWNATDTLGREVRTFPEVPAPRENRTVGIFYFLWLGQHSTTGPWDVSKILEAHPDALKDPNNPAWGPPTHYHHWGEPLFGYYISTDPWVYRKHAQMLSDAGVDTVIFDTSNTPTYPESYMVLLDTWAKVREEGGRTPQVAFLTPFGPHDGSRRTMETLWKDLYSPGIHKDLWFQWDGKPLIMAWPETATEEQREFFTFRRPHAPYFTGPDQPATWSWLQVHPQHVFVDEKGQPEQIAVGVAQNGRFEPDGTPRLGAMSEAGMHGRSWRDAATSVTAESYLHGYNVAEQWKRALEVDPEFIFVTGWNEWVAMRLAEFNGVREPVMFVDACNHEYSRDIEPMKGGYGDNYYLQLVDYVRQYKGAHPQAAAGPAMTITTPADWDKVALEYLDDRGDTMHRNHPGWGSAGPYVDNSGRNDIVRAKVAHDAQNIYFMAETSGTLTSAREADWMTLLIDTDRDPATGWDGFDVRVKAETDVDCYAYWPCRARIERWSDGAFFESGDSDQTTERRRITITIPRGTLKQNGGIDLEFKWSDNIPTPGDPMSFYTTGDTAPNGRFRWRYFVVK